VLAAGVPLYLEKPVATRVEDGERLVAAATAAGAPLAVAGFNRRFHPLFAHARVLLDAGAVGEVHAVSTLFCEPHDPAAMPAWKRGRDGGGGALLDLGTHHFDLLRWLFRDEVVAVDADISSTATEHDAASVRLRLAGGITATTYVSFRAGRVDAMEFAGDRGVLRVDRYARSLTVRLAPAGSFATRRRRVRPTRGALAWRAVSLLRPSREPSYAQALRAFGRAVRGRPAGHATLADGLRALEIVAAAERSIAGRAPVPLVRQ
jgi:predicted dehydrogenase